MNYGIIYPRSTASGWSDDAESLVGKIVGGHRIIFNSLGDGDYVVIAPIKPDEDEVVGEIDIYLNGIAVPAECVISIKDCTCSTNALSRSGCNCGGFKSEKEFKRKLEESRRNLKRS